MPTPFGPTTPRQVVGADREGHVVEHGVARRARGAGGGRPGSRGVRRGKETCGTPGTVTGRTVDGRGRSVVWPSDASSSTARSRQCTRSSRPGSRGLGRVRRSAAATAGRRDEATGSQPSGDAGVSGRVVPCTQGCRWGTGARGEQCRRAPGSSRPRCADDRRRLCAGGLLPPDPRRGVGSPQRAIEIIGIVIGIALVAAVARAHDCPTTSSGRWRPVSGCWPTTPSWGWTRSATRSRIAAG